MESVEPEDILRRLESVEKQNGEFGRTVRDLKDALAVTAEVQRRQAAVQKSQAEWLEQMQRGQQMHEQRMAEIEDKLNALIDIIDRLQRPPQS